MIRKYFGNQLKKKSDVDYCMVPRLWGFMDQ